jgi:hypothetical protein
MYFSFFLSFVCVVVVVFGISQPSKKGVWSRIPDPRKEKGKGNAIDLLPRRTVQSGWDDIRRCC